MADEEIMITSEGYSEYCKKFIPRSFIFVATAGFIFGYDIGRTGFMTSRPSFLKKFFPNAYENLTKSNTDSFFDDDLLNIYRSSAYLLAFLSSFIVTSFPVPYHCQEFVSLLFLGFDAITEYAYSARNFRRLIAHRITFGFGIGITIQLVHAHISKLTPCRYRGRVILWFQLAITIGILTSYLFCFVMSFFEIEYASSYPFFSLFVPFLCFVVNWEYAHQAHETTATIYSRSASEQVQIPLSSIISKRKYWPPLVVVICISVFQQSTCVYAFFIYAPILFETIGLGAHTSLLCSLIICVIKCLVTFVSFASFDICVIKCLVTFVSFASFDKIGRRNVFLHGGFLMLACQVIIAFSIGIQEPQGVIMPKWNATLLVVAICGYVSGFAWSCGPLGWLLPSEILPSEIQSIGQRISISVKMLFMFLVTQFFVIGFRKMTFHMCLIVLSLVVAMTLFVYIFLPETKGVEEGNAFEVWKVHPHWNRYIEDQVEG